MRMKPLTEGLAIAVAILFAVSSALGAPRPARPLSTQSPKHVLLIVPSDQGASDIGYEDSTFYTPTLNQLAAGGIKLRGMHTSSTDTATRASILTGLYPNNLGLQDGELHPGEARTLSTNFTLLPQLLHANGYKNYLIGTWHLGLTYEEQLPLQRGFDQFFGQLQGQGSYFNRKIGLKCDIGLPLSYTAINCIFINGVDIMEGNTPSQAYNPAVGGNSAYTTDILAAKAVDYINAHDATQPMFMYFAPEAPKTPLDTTATYLSQCPNVADTPYELNTGMRQKLCAMMAGVDNAVAQITAALSAKGMLDSTLIIYASSNGGAKIFGSLNGNFNGGKGEAYDGGVRSVAFVAGTPISAAAAQYGPERTDAVQATDIFATILQYAGAPVHAGIDSIPFWTQLVSGQSFTRSIVNLDFTGSDLSYSGAVKFQQNGVWYKYLNNPSALAYALAYTSNNTLGEFLFNLSTNPGEDPAQNLISSSMSTQDASAYAQGQSLMQQIISGGAISRTSKMISSWGVWPVPYHPSPSGCWIPSNSPYWSGTTAISCRTAWIPFPETSGATASQLALTNQPLTLTAGACSSLLRVESDWDIASPEMLSLSANPSTGVTFYSDAGCTTPVTSITMPVGSHIAMFYMKDTSAGSMVVTVSGTGPVTATLTQTVTVNAAQASQLSLTTPSLRFTAGACSGALTVQSQDSFGNASNVVRTETLSLSASPSTGASFYTDSSCSTTAVTSGTIAIGANSATFYMNDTLAGSPQITITGSGAFGSTITDSARVTAAAAAKLVFTNTPQTFMAGACSPALTVLSQDSFGNLSTVSSDEILTLSANPSTGVSFYAGTGCATAAVTSTTIPSGSNSATFYMNDANTGLVLVTVAGSGAFTDTVTQTETVDAAPAITNANNTAFTVGTAGSFTVTVTGFPAPAVSESGTLPNGVTFNASTNVLSGTPAAGTGGVYNISFTASNGVGSNAVQNFTLTVNQAPAITNANNTVFTVGTAGAFTVTATGFPTPVITETGALPNGVALTDNGNGTATLSGTPAAGTAAVYNISFTANNGVGSSAVQNFTLTVAQAPAITSASSTSFTVGKAGSFTVTVTGFPAPAVSESGALPSGVTFNASTKVLSGTPAAGTGGVYNITFTASNGAASNAVQSFTLTVNQPPAITTVNSAMFTVGLAGSFTVAATGTPTPTLSEGGKLPQGVTFTDNGNGTGLLSGTPASGTVGTYAITFNGSNAAGSYKQSFTLTVNQAPVITSAGSTAFTAGKAGSFTVTATGSPAPKLSESGTLPSGVTFNASTGVLSGTPAAGTGGVYNITFTATNGVTPDAVQNFTLTVNQAPTITSVNNATFTVGTAGSFIVISTGVPIPSLSEGGKLPGGVTFVDNKNGTATLSGTPAKGAGGTYSLSFTASNVAGNAKQSFTLTVKP